MCPVLGVDAGQLPNFILYVVFQVHLHEVDVFAQAFCRHAGKLAIVVAGLDLLKLMEGAAARSVLSRRWYSMSSFEMSSALAGEFPANSS